MTTKQEKAEAEVEATQDAALEALRKNVPSDAGFVTITHSGTKATARVHERTVSHYESKGWTRKG
jgi:F0F1-type ATP synthase membrane subunit b/b'